jgi:hypothetical protein
MTKRVCTSRAPPRGGHVELRELYIELGVVGLDRCLEESDLGSLAG